MVPWPQDLNTTRMKDDEEEGETGETPISGYSVIPVKSQEICGEFHSNSIRVPNFSLWNGIIPFKCTIF